MHMRESLTLVTKRSKIDAAHLAPVFVAVIRNRPSPMELSCITAGQRGLLNRVVVMG
jgi:hypothetical protein